MAENSKMEWTDHTFNPWIGCQKVSPGMAATVEIKTGSRRVIEYLLSPLLRYQQESLHER